MHKQKPPARDSQFVSLRLAATETGLPYALLYGAAKRGEIATFSAESRAVIYLVRASLIAWIERRLTKEAA